MKSKNTLVKTILASVIVTAIISLSSCKKDDPAEPSGLKVQAHNDNEMMKIMHKMSHSMDTMTKMNNVDHDFAMMMKMHHQGALDMANYELVHGDNPAMKTKANQIISAQTAEIAELNAFLNNHMDMDNTNSTEYNMVVMASMEKMAKGADLEVITGDSDNDFAALMITHHQSATEMAQAQIDYGKDADLKEMAKKMIKDQEMEISEFQDWLLNNKPY
ncbi:DUF305 domain-containing protein [Cytophaga hutchinsonii]|jgi:uncharacterized protein (DUF305 family)|uniref:DUF305 domain-containing protein n=1 Tax=Cytophaga hutchinsonii (strain ATCC 33406 / DSM 1761 / CIP 103989 / NBRC 15051 / NCIMB 9469 / D465) TaxID=269798 RepID=A0A6N4SR72_CYTH3|nr:DUF305 domain-containing protein [Cytophaga hutchinsonii]ABG58779.1 conserved hypothetical protein [Cytophaga hutchinsonii ATCC 33406]SFX61606.1 Uncharacterized conserved protein, DUF305 family [Cytophaga hutchinsonii ATCC 33406]